MSLFNKLQTMADDHNARARRTEERQAAVPGHLRAIVAAAPDECVSEVVRVLAGLMDTSTADASLVHLQAIGRKFDDLAEPVAKLADMLLGAVVDRIGKDGSR